MPINFLIIFIYLFAFQVRHSHAYFLRIMGNLLWAVYWPVVTNLDEGGDRRREGISQVLLPWWNAKKDGEGVGWAGKNTICLIHNKLFFESFIKIKNKK